MDAMNTTSFLKLANDLSRQASASTDEPEFSPEIDGSFGIREILVIIVGVCLAAVILIFVVARLRGNRLSREQQDMDTSAGQAPAQGNDFPAPPPSQPYQGYRPPRGQSGAAPQPHSEYQSYI